MTKTRPYRELLLDSLQDADYARRYLQATLQDYPEGFEKALRKVAEARGAGMSPSDNPSDAEGMPEIVAWSRALAAFGLKLSVEQIEASEMKGGEALPHDLLKSA